MLARSTAQKDGQLSIRQSMGGWQRADDPEGAPESVTCRLQTAQGSTFHGQR